MPSFAIISLFALIVVVAIGFVRKVNIGFLAIGVAFVIGAMAGMSEKQIIAGFSSSMFVTLAGVTFLFGLASVNGTLELISKKIVALIGKRTYLIPVTMFMLAAFLSAIGPGHIAIGILMTTFAIYLSVEMKINPFATALMAKLGANAGCASPISPTGVISQNLAEAAMLPLSGTPLFLSTLFSGALFATIIFVAYKCYIVKAENPLKLSDLPAFNGKQKLTMLVISALVVICIAFKVNVGLSSFIAASILIVARAVDEKKAIKGIPWGTLILVVGVGMLVNVIDKLGGITLVSNFLIGMMSEQTAVPIIAATSGILSWVSSTTGVVMPTMYPISVEVVNSFGGNVSFISLTSALVATSFAAAISPLSTGGAIIISAYSAAADISTAEQNRLFKVLFLLSVANVSMNVILAALGFFNLFNFFA
ncbi:C4-dicarboxylate ABC transporter [Betaproteobacteria bacterium]|nr:C4-dicarboxylate ABC transporter [Betaproteobacteria bacterium]GHU26603.1 C4-dicarboxylate ABC transporter [Betaproteobacteria bacterium]